MAITRRKKTVIIALLVSVTVLAVLYWRTSRAAYESAKYAVVWSDGDVEIRDYAALVLAETPMAGGSANRDGGFMRLFRFITGANETQQKLAMTTPVLIDADPAGARMSFVLPANVDLPEVARPKDASVSLRKVEPRRFAALRFPGSISEKSQDEAYEHLLERLKALGLDALSGPQFAYYDPPWTPPFWRRNEVLVRVAADTRR
jgi:hypothetical protein